MDSYAVMKHILKHLRMRKNAHNMLHRKSNIYHVHIDHNFKYTYIYVYIYTHTHSQYTDTDPPLFMMGFILRNPPYTEISHLKLKMHLVHVT